MLICNWTATSESQWQSVSFQFSISASSVCRTIKVRHCASSIFRPTNGRTSYCFCIPEGKCWVRRVKDASLNHSEPQEILWFVITMPAIVRSRSLTDYNNRGMWLNCYSVCLWETKSRVAFLNPRHPNCCWFLEQVLPLLWSGFSLAGEIQSPCNALIWNRKPSRLWWCWSTISVSSAKPSRILSTTPGQLKEE
jgi:hypothetical protein